MKLSPVMSLPACALVGPLVLGVLVLPGCSGPSQKPSPDGNSTINPRVLYLANDVFETQVKLVDVEPPPF
jgi:hypothetical protein